MFPGILAFIKTKLFSLPVVFIGILIAILSIFLIYNSDTILSKFGFETKSVLKAQVETLKKDLQTAERINKDLNEKVKNIEITYKNREKKLIDFINNSCVVEKKVSDILSKKKKAEGILQQEANNASKVQVNLSKKNTVSSKVSSITNDKPTTNNIDNESTTVLTIEQINKHSELQISTLNEVYNELFKKS